MASIELAKLVQHAMKQKEYQDLFMVRINEIERCLEQESYIAALSLTLTLPDMCGKAKYPADGVGKRYIKWYDEYIGQYEKPSTPYGDDMPYLSGEVVYSLRCGLLHAGNPDVDKDQVKDITCKTNRFILRLGKRYSGDTSCASYGANWQVKEREYTLDVVSFCSKVMRIAKEYYEHNKSQFNFFTYKIDYQIDEETL